MLRVENLTFSFKNRPLFQDLSFEVTRGQLIRVSGSNGSGKSTLLALITGLLSGATGTVKFTGTEDFRTWTSWIAPDANGLVPSLSAMANLSFWIELRGIATEPNHIREALKQWGLTGDWIQSSLPVSKFSTGMRRRLALARLQLEQSQLWLLDEPLFGLDDGACQQFSDALSKHIKSGGAAVLITHDDRILDGINHKTVQLTGASR